MEVSKPSLVVKRIVAHWYMREAGSQPQNKTYHVLKWHLQALKVHVYAWFLHAFGSFGPCQLCPGHFGDSSGMPVAGLG